MNIFLITHYFPPEIGAPQARLSEMAKVWQSQGHRVIVLTGFPNHPTGIIPEKYRGRFFLKEKIGELEVWRHYLYATANQGILKKTIGHLSFMFSCPLFSLFRGPRPGVIVASSPTFFSVFSALVFSWFRRCSFVFEVRDLWPGIFVELGVLKNKTVIKTLEWFELFLYRRAKWIIPVTNGFKENIVQRGICSNKVQVITNGVDLTRFSPGKKKIDCFKSWGIEQQNIVVLYAGAHGISHGLPAIIDVASEIQESIPEIKFLLVGEGAVKKDLISKAKSLDLKNVIFKNGVKKDEMVNLYGLADICLVPLKNIEGFKTFIPSKMFEIMACARPIIASLSGEAANILKQSGGAIVVEPENKKQMVDALKELSSDAQKREELASKGSQFVRKYYDREKLAMNYLEILTTKVCEQ